LVFPRIELVLVKEDGEIILFLTISVNSSVQFFEEWTGCLFWKMRSQDWQDKRVEFGGFGESMVCTCYLYE
jgi:hypothetical protein